MANRTLPHWVSSWLCRWIPHKAGRRRRPIILPGPEALEDRTLPSVNPVVPDFVVPRNDVAQLRNDVAQIRSDGRDVVHQRRPHRRDAAFGHQRRHHDHRIVVVQLS
jgi:hypothetical protein